ncbi:MAG TPA: RHS repeat-associated core domain-containing protein [Candidatus Dormibacteraeota bacterium]|jgi:RHS repeat-associated protein|nr:RHS repeat-associated core domain-containing protein [Candidatus Dormibacteraeota bacterium]
MKLSHKHLALIVMALSSFASAQVATGTPRFGSFGGGPFDTVNLGNLNVHFAIPVLHKAGRGTAFAYDLSYDSSIWTPVTNSGVTQWQPTTNWGWSGVTGARTGYMIYQTSTTRDSFGCVTTYYSYTYHDAYGALHPFPGTAEVQNYFLHGSCIGFRFYPLTSTASDGSGYYLSVPSAGQLQLTDRGGRIIAAPLNTTSGAASLTDANGNQVTVNSSGQFFDTLSSSTAVLTVAGSGTPSSPTTFTYNAPSGSATYKMNYIQYTVQTAFGFSSGSPIIHEYGPLSVPLVSSIALPDDTPSHPDRYTFTYESGPSSCSPCVTGRIQEITLPTGVTITYTYSGGTNNTGIYSDGSTAGLSRVLNPGGTWGYSRLGSGTPGPGSTWTTTVTNPNGDNTLINFAEDSTVTNTTSNPPTTATYNFYETQRQVNQLISGTQTLLLTTEKCYNGNYTNCSTTTVGSPIDTIDSYYQPANGNTRASHVAYDGSFNGSGLVSLDWEYDYGVTMGAALTSFTPLRKTTISYATLGNNIIDHPSQSSTTDGSGNLLSKTTYSYDESAYPVQTTTGTPQHTSVTGSRGNLTTVTSYSTSSASLSKHFQYNDTGTLYKSWDVNGSSTSYAYGTTTSCGNSFATTVTSPPTPDAPSGLAVSTAWNCTGGVATSTTDPNQNSASSSYSDSYFWRPASSQDQLSNTMNFNYTSPSGSTPASVESWMKFNSNSSISEHLTTLDSLGRVQYSQQQEGVNSGNYDSTQITYDTLGRPYQTTMPYVAGAGQGGSSAVTTTSYDALGRVTQAQDGGSPAGYVSYSYTQNDVLTVVGPAPSGENVKQVQKEYDGLGRLTSSCAISSTASGNVACNQNTGTSNGILTTTSYTSGAWYQTVSSTRASQTRSKTVDGLGRMTQKVTPEGGTWNYHYDSYSSCPTGYTGASGQLAAISDPNGNLICYSYDSLNRVTGVNADGTTCRHLYYDNSTGYSGTLPTGVSLSNQYGRLVEAATDACAANTLLTDEWFNYDKDGHMLTMWESTPNSSGYYKSTATFYGNGAVNTLALSGQSFTTTYGLDGKGRTSTLSIGSSTVVSGTTFYPATLTPTISIGTGTDNDAYTIDANTGRMTGYTFTLGSTTDAGVLTWNANGTLKKLAITDGFNSGGTQTCSFNSSLVTGTGYDDLGRLLGSSCGTSGSIWNQADSYDQYDNLTKSSTLFVSWNPGYSSTTNHYTCTGCTYDSNGDVTNDGTNAYTWNEFSRMASTNKSGTNCASAGQCVVYDALGRIVEIDSGSTHTSIWYTQLGKTAYMHGSTYLYSYWPAPGGATAMHNYPSSGAVYIMHKDWQGNARLVSDLATTVIGDYAFAPYGEKYDIFGSTSQNETMFISLTQDVKAGMYDTPNRELQGSQQGRWLSADPAGFGWNQYAYATNPNSFVDPSGLQLCPVWANSSGSGCGNQGGFEFGGNGAAYGNGGFDLSCGGNGFCNNNGTVLSDGTIATIGLIGPGYTNAWSGNGISDLPQSESALANLLLQVFTPAGIQIGYLMFQFDMPNCCDSDGNLIFPNVDGNATVVGSAWYLQVVNGFGWPLAGNFSVTENVNTVLMASGGQQVSNIEASGTFTWTTNSSGGFVDNIFAENPDSPPMNGLAFMHNVQNWSINGVPANTFNQFFVYNGSLQVANPWYAGVN